MKCRRSRAALSGTSWTRLVVKGIAAPGADTVGTCAAGLRGDTIAPADTVRAGAGAETVLATGFTLAPGTKNGCCRPGLGWRGSGGKNGCG